MHPTSPAQVGLGTPTPAPKCTPSPSSLPSFRANIGAPGGFCAPAGQRAVFLSAQSPCHPNWDSASVTLGTHPNMPARHSQHRMPSRSKPRAKSAQHLAVSMSAQAVLSNLEERVFSLIRQWQVWRKPRSPRRTQFSLHESFTFGCRLLRCAIRHTLRCPQMPRYFRRSLQVGRKRVSCTRPWTWR